MNWRLEREAIAKALHQGLGRAFLHVREHGLSGVEDVVLDACLHDRRYHSQYEPSRAAWLFQMCHNTPQYSEFRLAILDGLASSTEHSDLEQLFGLATEMASPARPMSPTSNPSPCPSSRVYCQVPAGGSGGVGIGGVTGGWGGSGGRGVGGVTGGWGGSGGVGSVITC